MGCGPSREAMDRADKEAGRLPAHLTPEGLRYTAEREARWEAKDAERGLSRSTMTADEWRNGHVSRDHRATLDELAQWRQEEIEGKLAQRKQEEIADELLHVRAVMESILSKLEEIKL